MLTPSLQGISQPQIAKVNGSFSQQARTTLTRKERQQTLRRRIEGMAQSTILPKPFFGLITVSVILLCSNAESY
ncbi:MAG: hypothetical protein CMP86_02955 [Gammaproteobacteria bacterium]|nr:hypothetical protein [Gammaproteobacteria bacterium]